MEVSASPGLGFSRRRFLAAGATLATSACAGLYLPRATTGNAEVNGTRLYYEVSGSGEPVVLLHGFTFDTRMWDEQFDVLAHSFRVIRYDARGFGRSALPRDNEPYSHVDDLDHLLGRLNAQQPHLVGLAMGGRFALDYAVTHPDRVRSVTVIGGVIGGWDWSKEWLASYAPIVQAGKGGDIALAKSLWLAHPQFAAARDNPLVAARLDRMVNDYSGWHFINASAERAVAPPAIKRLGAIRGRTLAIVGERDLADFHRMTETIERGVPNAKRVTIAGAGHVANMEAPDAVNRTLHAFLAG
jgi:3-oxoadipate enol-lactonase